MFDSNWNRPESIHEDGKKSKLATRIISLKTRKQLPGKYRLSSGVYVNICSPVITSHTVFRDSYLENVLKIKFKTIKPIIAYVSIYATAFMRTGSQPDPACGGIACDK